MERPAPLSSAAVPQEFIDRIPITFARDYAVVAIDAETLALGGPEHTWAADRVMWELGREMKIVPAEREDVVRVVNEAFHAESKDIRDVADELGTENESGEVVLHEDVLELDHKAPAVKLVHAVLLQAIKQRASDIHLDPVEEGLRLRFRIDGALFERALLSSERKKEVVSRIKVMAKMDIAEQRLPQDGAVTVRVGDHRIDLRVATLPSQFGERVVLRLLDKKKGLLSLDRLGYPPEDLEKMKRLLELHHGIIVVTGPTGSGKTTTLYAMLSQLDSSQLNIMTLEDPIEYQLPGITQTQVAVKKGLTFAKGLRSIVRQDPDIIMVGEIRDLETATIAIQSSNTGHLVFSTLHTNDAPSSITRLLDLGVEPYQAASSIVAIMAQRLTRTVCEKCKDMAPLDEAALRRRGWDAEDLGFLKDRGVTETPFGKGCGECFGTGYFGRTAIFELLVMTDPIRDLIVDRTNAARIKKQALSHGFLTLRKDGLRRVAAGLTTLEEVWAVTQIDI